MGLDVLTCTRMCRTTGDVGRDSFINNERAEGTLSGGKASVYMVKGNECGGNLYLSIEVATRSEVADTKGSTATTATCYEDCRIVEQRTEA